MRILMGSQNRSKEIDDVLLTCGYVADDSSKLVLDSLQLVERLLIATV